MNRLEFRKSGEAQTKFKRQLQLDFPMRLRMRIEIQSLELQINFRQAFLKFYFSKSSQTTLGKTVVINKLLK